jgi:hypothetical protein
MASLGRSPEATVIRSVNECQQAPRLLIAGFALPRVLWSTLPRHDQTLRLDAVSTLSDIRRVAWRVELMKQPGAHCIPGQT